MRIPWLLVAALALAAPGAARADVRAPVARVAQAPSKLDAAVAAVARAQKTLATLAAERAASTRRYQGELAEIDQLKRQRASWRRDRALRSKLASSLETAKALTALADQVRRADAEVARAKATAVAVFDAAIAIAPPGLRAGLERRRASFAAPVRAKKIILPDDALDPLADPEELDDQAAALREAEAALASEVARLDGRAHRFDVAAELRRQHERAEAMALTEDDDVRRVAVRSGSFDTTAEGAAAPPADGAIDAPSGRDLATALAAVVDARTVDVLRQSDRSDDPATWAAAARQAKDAVAARLETLRKRRLAIEARARELRRP